MQPRNLLMTVCLMGLAAWLCCLPAGAATIPPAVRGARVAVLRVAEGPLQIKVLKRDLNIYEGDDILRAMLYDPQLRVVAQVTIPDGGPVRGPGELQSAEMSLPRAAAGLYRLVISGGHDFIFGLETNATQCVLQGEILLNDPNYAGRIVFAPPPEAFKITARALHDPGRQQMPLHNQRGELIHQFNLAKTGDDQVLEVPADPDRQGLWTFEIGKLNVRLNLGRPLYWTTDPAAWFDAAATRGMLMPYREARNLLPGQKAQVAFEVTNNLGRPAVFEVRIQGDEALKLSGGEGSWTLQPREKRPLSVIVELAADRPRGSVLPALVTVGVAGEPELKSSSGLEVRVGEPALGPLPGPVVLRHFEHENLLFGYSPEYIPNEAYFDLANRPYLRQRTNSNYGSTGLQVLEGSQWVERQFLPAVREAHPDYRGSYGAGGFLGAKVVFDGQGGAYTMMQASLASTRQVLLLFTPDEGRSFQVYDLPGTVFDIEQFTGHNALQQPPPILLYTETRPHPATFASYFDLHLLLPRREGNRLVLGEPLKITDNCLGSCQHSGGPASSVTRDGRTHIVWGEISPDDAPGVPTYVATYDQATGKLSPKVLLGYGPPANDVHNVPAITMDSTGTLHVIIGSHGEAFQYTQSLRPNDSQSGWTPAAPVLSAGYVDEKNPAPGSGRQTYASLVCDPSDTLHIAYRQWRRNVDEYHPGQIYAALSVQSKPRDKEWGPAQPRVIPAVSGYSVYYHKLTIDRSGGLYLSYNYWTDESSYREYFPEAHHHRALQTSADGGQTWKLASTVDFLKRVKK